MTLARASGYGDERSWYFYPGDMFWRTHSLLSRSMETNNVMFEVNLIYE
jgi:hypothetical protein